MNQRDLFISLCFSGGDPDIAFLHNNKFTIDEYEQARETEEYKDFAEKVQTRFLENPDLALMGNLYRAQEAMLMIGEDHRNYPAIMKNYIEILKLTKPIIERLNKQRLEVQAFDGLELVIDEGE